jgi:phage terminase small subunit
MATRGQRPKPVALRLLNGNAGKRPINSGEPDTGPVDIRVPDCLSDGARSHWQRLAPMLANAGVLKASDHDLLVTYCETFAAYLDAVRKGGASMAMVGQLRQLMGELGMTPSARARITADKPPEADNGKARFFGT